MEGAGRPRPLPPLVVVAFVAVGLGLRLWILRSRLGLFDADEAVVGLMARRLLDGHATTFYMGQNYGGSQEAVLVAMVFAVVRSWAVALKVVPLLLSALAGVLVWRIGRRMFGEPAGQVAGLLVWVGPFAAVWLSTKERGFYGVTMVLGLVLVLFAVRLAERPSPTDAVVAGLVSGLGWWANPQIAYFALPALVWLVVLRPGLVRMAWLAVCGALVGAAPWFYANVGTGFSSLDSPLQSVRTTYSHRLSLFADPGLPVALGFRQAWTTDWLVPGLAPAVYGAALLAFAVATATVVRMLVRRRDDDGRGLLVLACLCYPFVFAISSFTFHVIDGRYIYFLWPFVALLAASFLSRRWLQVGAVALVAVLSTAGLASVLSERDIDPLFPDAFAQPVGPLLRALDDNGVTSAFADYWVAYRIGLATDERVSATPVLGNTRDPALAARVRSSPHPAYVLVAGSPSDQAFDAALRSRGIAFERVVAGDYVLYLPETPVMPESVPGL